MVHRGLLKGRQAVRIHWLGKRPEKAGKGRYRASDHSRQGTYLFLITSGLFAEAPS
jgi:hypothetical protein